VTSSRGRAVAPAQMLIDCISDLRAFVAVIEHGGVSAASRHLGRSIQSVSRSLAAVERAVGTELVRRTTRSSSATSAGAALYRRVAGALSEIDQASAEAAGARDRPLGVLRVSAPPGFAPVFVVPVVAAYLAANPQVDVELKLEERYVDLVNEGHDLAVRIGAMPDSSLKTRRLGGIRNVTFAAPSYLAERGRPTHPRDLASHACIIRSAARDPGSWTYAIDGELASFAVAGPFRTNNTDAATRAAAEASGIANGPYWNVRPMLDDGSVELVLSEFEPPAIPVHAVWPATAQVPAKTRLFVDQLAAHLKRQQL